MRRQLAFHNGYEINTQGDAFECGFHNIESAIRFCIRVQMDLLDTQWTEEVLALPFCHEKRDSQDRLVFAGPRVRMGIHLGRKGTFSKRLNPRTHHIQFGGPGYHFAEEVGDSGNGGQIIMTGSTYQAARKPGALSTGLVVFNHLGMFQFERSNEPTSIFEVSRAVPVLASEANLPARC